MPKLSCKNCGQSFQRKPSRVFTSNFCSRVCKHKTPITPETKKKIKLAREKQGGRVGVEKRIGKHYSPRTEFKKGLTPWNKGKPYLKMRGEKHWKWKGGVSKQKGYGTIKANIRRARKFGNGGRHTLQEWEELKAKYNHMCLCCKKFEPE